MYAAIIDLGTNSFHFLLLENGSIIEKQTDLVRLGQGGISKKIITDEARNRAVKAIEKYKQTIDKYKVKDERIFAYGTSALRSAANADEVIEYIWDKTRIKIKVIHGFEEAELIYNGVKQAVYIENNALIIDIGGGSTEFVVCDADTVLRKSSIEVGAERLFQEFIHHDPVLEREIQLEQHHLNKVLEEEFVQVSRLHPAILIGSGGSFTTLKDMIYYQQIGKLPPESLISYHCMMEDIVRLHDQLITSDFDERAKMPGLPLSRVEVIVPVVIMIKLIMERLDFKEVFISEYSLKEGAVLKM